MITLIAARYQRTLPQRLLIPKITSLEKRKRHITGGIAIVDGEGRILYRIPKRRGRR